MLDLAYLLITAVLIVLPMGCVALYERIARD